MSLLLKLIMFFIFLTTVVSAEAPKVTSYLSFQELNKLGADNQSENSHFGNSVAISGNTVVVGAHGYNSSAGTAYVYEYDETSKLFVQIARLRASDTAAGDEFGSSVAIANDVIVIGATADDDGGSNFGSAYIFEKPSLGWSTATETAKLTASDAAVDDYFGFCVAISRDIIVIGAYGDDDSGPTSGSAYLFKKPLSGWVTATETAKLTASDAAAGDYFGDGVAINGDIVVIG